MAGGEERRGRGVISCSDAMASTCNETSLAEEDSTIIKTPSRHRLGALPTVPGAPKRPSGFSRLRERFREKKRLQFLDSVDDYDQAESVGPKLVIPDPLQKPGGKRPLPDDEENAHSPKRLAVEKSPSWDEPWSWNPCKSFKTQKTSDNDQKGSKKEEEREKAEDKCLSHDRPWIPGHVPSPQELNAYISKDTFSFSSIKEHMPITMGVARVNVHNEAAQFYSPQLFPTNPGHLSICTYLPTVMKKQLSSLQPPCWMKVEVVTKEKGNDYYKTQFAPMTELEQETFEWSRGWQTKGVYLDLCAAQIGVCLLYVNVDHFLPPSHSIDILMVCVYVCVYFRTMNLKTGPWKMMMKWRQVGSWEDMNLLHKAVVLVQIDIVMYRSK